ncbi:hypothetical protein ICNINCKA_02569 [Synechococcus sp. CBW1107]|nr:hypothetical protein ICNINCKA_02569 [Synechococcus sp. CBW1107]
MHNGFSDKPRRLSLRRVLEELLEVLDRTSPDGVI